MTSNRARLAKGKAKRKKPVVIVERVLDATPERIRMAANDDYEFINAAEIDPREQAINQVRRFRDNPFDRMLRANVINHKQWMAGDWYRDLYAKGMTEPRVTASYGERTTKGGNGGESFLPRSHARLLAREMFRDARSQWPKDMIGAMDKLLLRNQFASTRGYVRMRSFSDVRRALDEMVAFLRL